MIRVQEAIVVYIIENGRVLLGEKTIKYCAGRLVGPGGKREAGETIQECAIRETEEECGLRVYLQEPIGIVTCHNQAGQPDIRVYMFRTSQYIGTLCESVTLKNLRWYTIEPATFERMMEGDRLWFGYLARSQPFAAEVWYDQDWHLINATIDPLRPDRSHRTNHVR